MSDALDLEHLRALRAEIAAFRADMESRMDGLDVRLTLLDRKIGRLRLDMDEEAVRTSMVKERLESLTGRIERLAERLFERVPN